ncbi:MAG: phosphoenolpyruvate--protein phosphotransferase [Candidatus Cloacimonetes bacterium]|nr:phosphoenolpyruvate--protein phosphotransferase [Candidatus Cloacimonadota bacterium]
MMKILRGIPISSGLVAGKVTIIKSISYATFQKSIKKSEVEKHISMFKQSIKKSLEELQLLFSFMESDAKDAQEIILSHQEMLKDKVFHDEIISIINDELVEAEFAIHSFFEKLINDFSKIEDNYLSQRKEDFRDIKDRIIKNLSQNSTRNFHSIPKNKITVIDNISVSFMFEAKNSNVLGIIAKNGTANSHSAIIAKSLDIPVVFEVKDALVEMKNNDFILLNGNTGTVIVSPSDEKISEFQKNKKKEKRLYLGKLKLAKLPTSTKNNQRIQIMSNIEIPDEAKKIEVKNSDGIGLFRTEFLYYIENKFPTTERQYKFYRDLIKFYSENKPIYIRTFDIGGDKLSNEFGLAKELNPYLGCRGIRFSLRFPKIFKDQIKAILRAGAFGNLKIMLPMITSKNEIIRAKKIINDVKFELKKSKMKFDENIEIGIMIEVPAAAIQSEQLADVSDFFSIGTNDLTQYILAADRDNETLAESFNYFHPAVLQLIEISINAAKKRNIPISICGEMAGDEIAVPLLLGMGLKCFSISKENYLNIKDDISNYELDILRKKYTKIKRKSQIEIFQFYKKIMKETKETKGL